MKRKKFDSDPLLDDKCLKNKIKSCNNKIKKKFKNGRNNSARPPKEVSKYICLPAAVIDSVIKLDKFTIYRHF